MSEAVSVQWFPGHMAKTRRIMKENLTMVDIVVELRDARIPKSSRNPEIEKIVGDKPRIIVLNKADEADPNATKRWIEYYQSYNVPTLAVDCKSGRGINKVVPTIREVIKPKIERLAQKGIFTRPIRMMIVGIPNVGKSYFINTLAGEKKAKVEDRPGVTRDKQWVKVENGVELLDMPGVLWPKFDDPKVGELLAFTGAVKDDVIDIEHLARRLLELMSREYVQSLTERYKITKEELQELDGYELLALVGKKRGMLMAGGVVNTERAAIAIVDEYRGGKLGKFTLEMPPKPKATDVKNDEIAENFEEVEDEL
ncbi:MAG: ribosome biogenesis GTPase YlqF [Oscillospiraceae bacterium]